MDKIKIFSMIVVFAVLASYTDYLISPESGSILDSTRIKFEKLGFGNVLIDDNQEFTSPILVYSPFIIELSPGLYYWRGSGISEIYNFTILSNVALNLKFNGTYELENQGNVQTNVTIATRKFSPLGYVVLDVGKSIKLNLSNEILLGKQNE